MSFTKPNWLFFEFYELVSNRAKHHMLDNWSKKCTLEVSVMATELVSSTILFATLKSFCWNKNLNLFHRYLLKALYLLKAYFSNLIRVSFHVVVWRVCLMLHNFVPAFVCFIIFTSALFDYRWWTQPATLSQIQEWNTRKKCGICSKLTIKTSERHQYFLMFSCHWSRFDVFVNFEQI